MAAAIRILYVDDEPDLLGIGKLFLEDSGDFIVTTALSAAEALRLLEQEKFDAIISDYQMPGMDGIQFLIEVRKRLGPIPFILFTGRGREEIVIQAINSGADFYLQKGGEPGAQFAELTHKIKAAASSKRADDALRKSEEKYRHLIEHSNEAIVVAQDGMLKLVNHKTIEFTGYSEQELLSMQFSAFIHADDRAMVVERYQKRIKGEEGPSRYAFRLSSKDGSTRWVEISVVMIDWDGRPATLNFLTDITDRKRAEMALKKNETLLKRTGEIARIGGWEMDAETLAVTWTEGTYHIHEVPVGQMPPLEGAINFFHPDERARLSDAITRALTTGEGYDMELRFITATGKHLWIRTICQPQVFNGKIIRLEGTIQDITDRKVAEEVLRLKDFAIESSLNAIAIADLSGNLTDVNASFLSIWGYEHRQEVLGQSVLSFWKVPEEAQKVVAGIQAQGTWTGEMTGQRKDGTPIQVQLSANLIRDVSGMPVAMMGSFIDITERKRAEEKNRERLETLLRLSEMGSASDQELMDYVLDAGCRLTNSSLAFIGVMSQDETIFDITSWSKSAMKDCSVAASPIHFPIDKAGIWAEAVRQRKPFIVNNYTAPRMEKIGLPPGHVPITRFTSLPIFDGQRIVMVSAVANKETNYSDLDVYNLTLLMHGVWNHIRKRSAEAAFRQLSSDHKVIIDNAPAMVWYKDTKNNFIRVNPAGAQAFGLPVEEIEGKSTYDLFPDFAEKYYQDDLDVINSGKPRLGIIEPMTTASGEHRWVQTDKIPLRDEQGTITGILVFSVDITGRKRTEDALRESEERLRTIILSMQFGIVIIDAQTHTILEANDKALEMIGGNSESVAGSVCHRFICPAELGKCPVTDLGQNVDSSERVLLNLRGEKVPILKSVIRTTLGGKDVLIESFIDITERKKAEEALALASKKLSLLSGITRHDINNQLTILLGYLTILKKKQSDPAFDEYFVKVSTAAQRISSMIQFTKEYEKIGVKAPAWQNCRTLVDTAAKQAPLGKIMVKNDLPVGTEVFADPLIVKVCYNLMDNAVRYGGKITFIRFAFEEAGDCHLIVCEDDGDGVIAEEKEKIFERGFGKNTGLGLAISREILSITGITIRETGEPGKGARFEMTVPKGAWRVA